MGYTATKGRERTSMLNVKDRIQPRMRSLLHDGFQLRIGSRLRNRVRHSVKGVVWEALVELAGLEDRLHEGS